MEVACEDPLFATKKCCPMKVQWHDYEGEIIEAGVSIVVHQKATLDQSAQKTT
jgi:hypothetical protein